MLSLVQSVIRPTTTKRLLWLREYDKQTVPIEQFIENCPQTYTLTRHTIKALRVNLNIM